MSSTSDMEVASYLAQRKAKKAGGSRFKTFTAAAAFIAGEDQVGNETTGESGERSHAGYSAATLSNAVANTLVQGEWIEDEASSSVEPRLLTSGGGQVADLESLALEEKLKAEKAEKEEQRGKSAYPVRQPPPELSAETASNASRLSTNRRAQADFPALGASPAAPVPSVWGNRAAAAAAVQQQAPTTPREQEQPAPVADAKPGVWRPKSLGGPSPSAAAPRPSPVSNGPSPAMSRPAPAPAADGGNPDGLRRAAQPWRPRNMAADQ